MSHCNSRIISFLALYLFLISAIIFPANSLYFKFNFSDPNTDTLPAMINLQGNASFNKGIWLTNETTFNTGRAVYRDPVPLWDKATGKIADFTTHFSFIINAINKTVPADGLGFFLSYYPSSTIPKGSEGGRLGLFNETTKWTVAVEFDTYQSKEDTTTSLNHVGIDVNSIVSVASVPWDTNFSDGRTANAWISYNATTSNLGVFLTFEDNPIFTGNYNLSYTLDLSRELQENVSIGFSAATGGAVELVQILYWDFNSSISEAKENNRRRLALIIGLSTAFGGLVVFLVGFSIWFILREKKARTAQEKKVQVQALEQEEQYNEVYDETIDDEFEKGRGPRRFAYRELAGATENFAEEHKLGEGGFGDVYKGLLKDLGVEVAIKRVSKGSKQGRKEYIAEVKIISQLRHRNLVQLVGWCHDRGDFLLVYELMPNGSLDSHLYKTTEKFLTWSLRYNIALGLASALLYLHEEWESCVVHRDIKPSNVMLDSAFNAKLGDFGLARLVDHEGTQAPTVTAGTMGYVAPECVVTGMANKESDVYSFGIVALELACGRRPMEINEDQKKVRLVEWVWDLYGRSAILEAADERVNNGELEVEEEIERLMVVGLWCAHPDCTRRPSIRQVINVLKVEAPLPALPPTMPVPMYFPQPPMDINKIFYTSTTGSSSSTSAGYTCPTASSSFLLR